jgi:hypothetical protein
VLAWRRQAEALQGQVSEQELERFFAEELDTETRTQLLSLPPGEMQQSLRRLYRRQPGREFEGPAAWGRWPGREGRGPAGPRQWDRDGPPPWQQGPPGERRRGRPPRSEPRFEDDRPPP